MDSDHEEEVSDLLEQVQGEEEVPEQKKRKNGKQPSEKRGKKKKQDVGFKQIDPPNQGNYLFISFYILYLKSIL